MRRKKRRIRYPKRRLPLQPYHYRAIDMLTQVPRMNYEEIASELGVNRRTLFRWRQRPDFDRELRREINRKWEAYQKTIPKPNLLAMALSGDVDAIEWFFNAAGFV